MHSLTVFHINFFVLEILELPKFKLQGPVVRKVDSAIHWIVFLSTVKKCMKSNENTDISNS